MSVALSILLIAFCVQGLVKFAVGFLGAVPNPNETRSRPTISAAAASSASTTRSP